MNYNAKNRIERELPHLYEVVETILFFQSIEAWLFYWNILKKQCPIKTGEAVFLEIKVKDKKKFKQYFEPQEYLFYCKLKQNKIFLIQKYQLQNFL